MTAKRHRRWESLDSSHGMRATGESAIPFPVLPPLRIDLLRTTTATAGYLKLMACAYSFSQLRRAGVEGAGAYGAGLTHVLRDHEVGGA